GGTCHLGERKRYARAPTTNPPREFSVRKTNLEPPQGIPLLDHWDSLVIPGSPMFEPLPGKVASLKARSSFLPRFESGTIREDIKPWFLAPRIQVIHPAVEASAVRGSNIFANR
ncbi:hypothetical protein TCAL_15147, partial [Tigriopus californicus]